MCLSMLEHQWFSSIVRATLHVSFLCTCLFSTRVFSCPCGYLLLQIGASKVSAPAMLSLPRALIGREVVLQVRSVQYLKMLLGSNLRSHCDGDIWQAQLQDE